MAETIGEWQWDRQTKRLTMTLTSPQIGSLLSGDWALDDLSHVIDGLSRQHLRSSLETPNGDVALELVTAEGDVVHLAGGAVDSTRSRGIILAMDRREGPTLEGPVDLVPVYQPILCLRAHRVDGFEALARWSDNAGEVGPVSDRKGLATSMLIHAAEALKTLRSASGNDQLFMQVNVTSHDLKDAQLVELITELQDGHGLAPKSIKLELTEQVALRDTSQTLERIKQLREAGAGIVLDDFGSGHSSFQWLADLPADSLKVDASLIAQMDNRRVETILEGLTLISRRLGMTSTAEGVEDAGMMARLRELGFDHAQGFALGRPMTVNKAEAFFNP